MKYKRLPGSRRGVLRRHSLWLGDDHLLAVASWRFVEDYKRYYYRDIQAVVLARTRRWVVSLPWIVPAAALALTALIAAASTADWLAEDCLAALAGLAVLWLVVSLAASSRCRLQTAVGHDELPSLCRWWSARRAIGILAARIAEAQGTLVEGWAVQTVEAPAPEVPLKLQPRVTQPAPPPDAGGVSALEIAFYASLALGAALFLAPSGWLWFVLILVQMGLAATTLIRHSRRGGRRSSQTSAIALLVAGGLAAVAAYSTFVAAYLRAGGFNPRTPPHGPDLPALNPALAYVYAAVCLVIFAAGVVRRVKE